MKKFLSGTLFKLLVSLAILAFMVHMMDSREVIAAVRQCSPLWLAFGLGALLLSNIVAAHQWYLLLRAQEIGIGWFKAQGLYQIGIYFNNFLPGSVGGDVVKIFRLAKYYKCGQAAFAATFMDRFVGFFLLLLFSLAGIVYLYYVLAGEGFNIQGRRMIFLIGQIALLYTLLVAIIFSRRLFNLVIKYLVRPLGW
jgi:glycosyltransferase 2 family protein